MFDLPPLAADATQQERTIYLDYHATTPCDPRVVEAMLPFFTEEFANPGSVTHRRGRSAAAAVSTAREQVAELIGASPGEIVFTGSATESNNIALLGLADAAPPSRRVVVTTAIEHKSVLEPIRELGRRGFDVRILPVDREGRLDFNALEDALSDAVFLVSVQVANNEIGTIQNVDRVAELAHGVGAAVHCDAVQAAGRVPVDIQELGVDFLSVSAHKMYGPKGIAALYVRGGPTAWPLRPLMFGGGHEFALRPGTLNVPAIVGFGEAAELVLNELPAEMRRVSSLRDQMETTILSGVPGAVVNGCIRRRLPGNSCLTLPGVDADALMANLPQLAISRGSACTSGTDEPSHALLAVGCTRRLARQSIRIGVGRFSNSAEVSAASSCIVSAAEHIRNSCASSH